MSNGKVYQGKAVVKGEETDHVTINLVDWLSYKLGGKAIDAVKECRYQRKRREILDYRVACLEREMREALAKSAGSGGKPAA